MSSKTETKQLPFRPGYTLEIVSDALLIVRELQKDGSWIIHEIKDIDEMRKVREIFGAARQPG